MAMTKKEQAEVAELKRKLSLVAALRWTDPVEPDVPYPTGYGDKLSTGFCPCYDRVEVACSSAGFHAVGRTDKTTSQQPRSLYSTRILALKALRHEVELRCANELARVDRMIEQEVGGKK
jgi:hypothetical protein